MGLYFINLIIALPFAYLFLFKTTYWVKERGEWINKGRYKFKLWQWLVLIITLLFPIVNLSYFALVIMALAEWFDEYDEKLTLCEGLTEKLNKRY